MAAPQTLHAALDRAISAIEGGSISPTVERPRQAAHGDYATNAAMLLAPALKAPPREIAERLGAALSDELGEDLERFEVAGPGFLNLHLADRWHRGAVGGLLAQGPRIGAPAPDSITPERILLEFVSANPTGPLTAAGGRHAAYGDALARVLEHLGNTVEREYYINDSGLQVLKLGLSIQARARGEDVPEGGYEGDYVRDLAAAIPGAANADPEELAREGVRLMMEKVRATLVEYRVEFDTYFSEHELRADGTAIRDARAGLESAGHTYVSDGALWLRTTSFGDDKDRVLLKADGEPTYFDTDIGYHQNKRAREFDRLIDVWGADHHGYVVRMKAAYAALGGDPDELELIIMQFVSIVGRKMSKRRGDFVTLDEVIADIGVDAARFLLLQRSHDTPVELDLDLAKSETADNPVYYCQYAHARISSVLAKAGETAVDAATAADLGALDAPLHPSERALVAKLLSMEWELRESADRRAPHRVANWTLELAQEFTAFYRDCPVVKEENADLRAFRLVLLTVTRTALATALAILGVTAPERMERQDDEAG